PRSGYLDFIKSLRHIAIHKQWLRIAMQAKNIRESAFRTEFFSVQGELMRKRRRIDDSEEQDEGHPYNRLREESTILSDSSDSDFIPTTFDPQYDSEPQHDSEVTSDEDITGEIPSPKVVGQFVGPGIFSSELACGLSSHIQINGQDINVLLMAYRRTHAIKAQATTECEQLKVCLVNFVVTKALLVSVLPEDISSDIVKYIFPDTKPSCISPSEQNFVTQLCAQSATCDFVATQEWFKKRTRRSGTRWSCDPLCGSKTSLDYILEFPDYQVSFGEHSYILGEFKTVVAISEDMRKDYKKLIVMGKKVVEGLFQDGFSTPVILIHGQGMEINAMATSSYNLLKEGKRVRTDEAWMRGTFNVKGVTPLGPKESRKIR
ncbi:hypothetical protein BGZ95_005648, partial [Linnemannia exigua]